MLVGEVTITASGSASGQNFEASATLNVTDAVVSELIVEPVISTLPVGLEQQYRAQVILSDNQVLDVTQDSAISWQTSDSSIASISNNTGAKGLLEAREEGAVTVTASGIANGQRFEANTTLSDDSTLDVTTNTALNWSSNNPAVAIINPSTGLATGIATGVATITATGVANEQSFTASVTLNVTTAIVTSLEITPTEASIPRGQTQQFVATAMLSDGSELTVTNNSALSWVSSAPQVAEITSSLSENNGVAKGLTIGVTEITATAMVNGTLYSTSADLEVTDKDVSALRVEGAASIPVYNYLGSLTRSYQVIAEYSDGEIIEYPGELEWTTEITTPGLATFDTETQSITTFPPEDEVSGDVTLTACTSQGVCSSKRVVLFTRIIQVLEGVVGGTDKTCEDIGYGSITIEAFEEIFNSEYRPEDVVNWSYRRGTWSYGLVANVYGRIQPNTDKYINKASYIVTGASEYETGTYDILSTSYPPNHLICKID